MATALDCYLTRMANTKGQRGSNGKKVVARGGHYRSAKTGRYVSTTIAESEGKPKGAAKYKIGKTAAGSVLSLTYKNTYGVGAKPIPLNPVVRVRRSYTKADEEQVVRLARAAEQARTDPGEDLSGLSREEFLARLLG